MENQKGLNINQNEVIRQIEMNNKSANKVNSKFENEDIMKLNGFDFGLSENDWGKDLGIVESEFEQLDKQMFDDKVFIKQKFQQTVMKQVDDDLDEFQAFQQQQQNIQIVNITESFFAQQDKQSQLKQKRMRLESLYSVSKIKSVTKRKGESELEQLIKFNQVSQQMSSKNSTRSPSRLMKSTSQQEESDFLSLEQYQKRQEQNQFAVFNTSSPFSQKQIHQKYQTHAHAQQKQFPNSPNNLLLHSNNDQQQFNNFQTQILLSPQIIMIQQQQNETETQHQKTFSIKSLPLNLCAVRLVISAIFITVALLLYGFKNSLFLVIFHDFLIVSLLIREIVKIRKLKNSKSFNKTTINKYQTVNSKVIVDLNQISFNDLISYRQNRNDQKNSQIINQYQLQLKQSLKYHKYLKYSLYISSLSLLIFILVQITQIDTFFTANYFSFYNWWHIIVVSVIFITQIWSNYRLIKKIDQVMFYENNYIKAQLIQ